jgi:uncharacterized protein with PIN domain
LQATLTTSADDVVLPSSQYLEIVMVPRNAGLSRLWLDGFLSRFDIRIAAFTESTARLAADAFERYGKGTGHPARLNFGDCFAYAVAMKKKRVAALQGRRLRADRCQPRFVKWASDTRIIAHVACLVMVVMFATTPLRSQTHVPCVQFPECRGCGCKGGPGFRGPDNRCVGHKDLFRICGNPPTTFCRKEGWSENTNANRECVIRPQAAPPGNARSF